MKSIESFQFLRNFIGYSSYQKQFSTQNTPSFYLDDFLVKSISILSDDSFQLLKIILAALSVDSTTSQNIPFTQLNLAGSGQSATAHP